jgi:glycosyltransferase involved in cell wall biosynthesis
MMEGYDILCFAPGPWNDIWRNRHQIMSRLARANRVLYVEPWPYLHPTLRRLRRGQVRWSELSGPRLSQVDHNLYVYRPALWAPRSDRSPLREVAQALYMARLKRALRQLEFRAPILWLFSPDMEVFAGRFGEQLVVYHIVDEYASYSGVSETWRPVVQRMEERLARRADLVFVTSPLLLEHKRALNEHTYWVPNAVDYAAFAAASSGMSPLPADVAHIPPPIAGYVGAINDKVDLALLTRLARTCADVSLLLVGPVTVMDPTQQHALEELRSLPNVHLLGVKSVEQVPCYVAVCNVCLLPYRINEWTRNIDSLKLYEYLACGKPVVATDLPAVRRFSPVVRIAVTEAEFAAQVRAACSEDNPARQDERRRTAAQNTWEQRVVALSVAIEERLRKRPDS